MSTTSNTFTESTANLAETAVIASVSPAPAVPVDGEVQNEQKRVLPFDEFAALLSPASALAVQHGLPILDASPVLPADGGVQNEQELTPQTNEVATQPSSETGVAAECDLPNIEKTPAVPEADNDACETQWIGQHLDCFVAQLPASTAIVPVAGGEQDEPQCDLAKRAIMRYYGASIISEYLQGRYLFILQTERAKPGTGKFVADLAQLREAGALLLSNATSYRRIFNYKIVREGLADLLASRSLSQAEKDKWPGGITELTVDDFEEALEQRKAADEGALEFEAMIEEAKQKQKKLKQEQGGTTTLNLQFFGLTDADKKRLRDAFAALVQAKGKVSASQFVVNVLCMVAQGGKAVSA